METTTNTDPKLPTPPPPRPRGLTVLAWVFIIYGISEAWAMVASFATSSKSIKLTVLMIPVGIGLLRGRSTSVVWARIWLGIIGIGCLMAVILFPFSSGAYAYWGSTKVTGAKGELVAVLFAVVIVPLVWKALKVLGSDATREFVRDRDREYFQPHAYGRPASESGGDELYPPGPIPKREGDGDAATGQDEVSAGSARDALRVFAGRGSAMTTVAECFNMSEAMRFQFALQAAEIPSFIPDENMAVMAPHHFLLGNGVRVQVAEEDAEAARRVIAEAREEDRRGEGRREEEE